MKSNTELIVHISIYIHNSNSLNMKIAQSKFTIIILQRDDKNLEKSSGGKKEWLFHPHSSLEAQPDYKEQSLSNTEWKHWNKRKIK